MEIHIEHLPEGGLELEFEEAADAFPVLAEMARSGECEFTAPIKSRLKAERIEDMVKVEGSIQAYVRLPCNRCLESYETPLASTYALTFTSRVPDIPAEEEAQEVELTAADMGLVYFQGDTIDLRSTIQEQVVMDIPIKSLCSRECKGLCPGCGVNLNFAACTCSRQSVAGSFSKLKDLKI